LKRVLQLAAPTLTDLDLSFAYTGYHGAEALAAVLARSDCQLVRLGLAGNAMGDQALEVPGPPLSLPSPASLPLCLARLSSCAGPSLVPCLRRRFLEIPSSHCP